MGLFAKYESIRCSELAEKMKHEKVKLIDVREKDEYASFHIEGSKSMPLSNLGNTYVTLDKSETYYLMCHSGMRSANAARFLHKQGYNVINVKGGIMMLQGALKGN